MAGAIEQIERELVALDKATIQCETEFLKLYSQYLDALGQAVKQQLVLASYYLCTQAYPERFLNLSLIHRQKLQQAMRKLGDEAKTQFQLQRLQAASQNSEVTDTKPRIQMLLSKRVDRESNPGASEKTAPGKLTDILTETSPRPKTSEVDLASLGWISPESPSSEHLSPDMPSQDASQDAPQDDRDKTQALSSEPLTPSLVARQRLILEQRIREVLQTLSKTANHILQQADILPALPESLLAAASESEAIAEVPAGPPNLLNLFVEIGGDQSDSEDEEEDESETAETASMTHLIAINLRLSEIEFADSTVSAWRSKIRSLLVNLKKLAQIYKKKQRERTSAEAEAAWRASWYEEE